MLRSEHPKPCEISNRDFITLNRHVVECQRCPRLISHCREVAVTKRRAYLDWDYWGKPVPSFGDPSARLLILGLAPGAHGANRTGRMFTGDRSGEFLYRSLHKPVSPHSPRAGAFAMAFRSPMHGLRRLRIARPRITSPRPWSCATAVRSSIARWKFLHTFKLWWRWGRSLSTRI